MLTGAFASQMDTNGRIIIPARHRELLSTADAQKLVITVHHESACLVLRPAKLWEQLAREICDQSNRNKSGYQMVRRKVLGYAQDVVPDANGRIQVSPTLRDYAGITKKTMVVGVGDMLEIWDEENWQTEVFNPIRPADSDDIANLPL